MMTNEEAIERLKSMLCKDDYSNGENSKSFQLDVEAISMAIEALNYLSPNPCSNCLSRHLCNVCSHNHEKDLKNER